MFGYKNKKGGFTLIELLVVISIISLLSSVVLSSLNDARAKARDAQRLSDMRQLQNALEMYRNDKGEYPRVGYAMNNSNNSTVRSNWNTSLRNALVVNNKYIPELPNDPKPQNTTNLDYIHNLNSNDTVYGYQYYSHSTNALLTCPSGQYYILTFRLEANKNRNLGPGFIRCDTGATYRITTDSTANIGLYTIGMGK